MKKISHRSQCHFRYTLSFLEKHIIIKFLVARKFHYGPMVNVMVRPYLIGLRRNTSLFNIYIFLFQMRKMLYMIQLHSYSRKLIVILATNPQINQRAYRKFYLFTHWLPGFLTNFRQLMCRALAETRYRQTTKLTEILSGALYIKHNPQLPTLTVSLTARNHWFYTEGHHLGLIQLSNSAAPHTEILPINRSYLPIHIILQLVRETIIAASLEDRYYFKRNFIIKPLHNRQTRIQQFK
jgi:hypothetical protein